MRLSVIPLLAVLAPALGAVLIAFTGERRPNLRELWSFVAGLAMLALVASMVPEVLAGKAPGIVLFHLLPGIELAFRADAFGLLFAIGASVLWLLTSAYSIGYMRSLEEHAQTRYFACFALALTATVGVALAANLFTHRVRRRETSGTGSSVFLRLTGAAFGIARISSG